jgi:hypothetical protein
LRHSDPRLTRAVCETLEQRQLLSFSPAISGGSTVNEGSEYELGVDWSGADADAVLVGWGDGTSDVVSSSVNTATHT